MRGRDNKVGPDPFWNIENYLTIYTYLHKKNSSVASDEGKYRYDYSSTYRMIMLTSARELLRFFLPHPLYNVQFFGKRIMIFDFFREVHYLEKDNNFILFVQEFN